MANANLFQLPKRLQDKIMPEPMSGCWLWLGTIDAGGYGKANSGLENFRGNMIHRISFTYIKGDIPKGLHLDHLCRVRSCCNPDHLEPVTIAENNRRGMLGVLRTKCKMGHLYSLEGHIDREGHRVCRTCMRAFARKHSKKISEERWRKKKMKKLIEYEASPKVFWSVHRPFTKDVPELFSSRKEARLRKESCPLANYKVSKVILTDTGWKE